jgi:serine/threonine protein kinase
LPSLHVGNCWHIGKTSHNFVYLSPEAVLETNVRSGTEKMDVYGFGILVWELCYLSAGKWYSSVDREAYIRSMSLNGSRPPIPSRWPTRIQALINNCTQQGHFLICILTFLLENTALDVTNAVSFSPNRWVIIYQDPQKRPSFDDITFQLQGDRLVWEEQFNLSVRQGNDASTDPPLDSSCGYPNSYQSVHSVEGRERESSNNFSPGSSVCLWNTKGSLASKSYRYVLIITSFSFNNNPLPYTILKTNCMKMLHFFMLSLLFLQGGPHRQPCMMAKEV